MIVGYDTEHDADESLAGGILRTLIDAYPGHAWFVLIRGGVIQVKNTEWHHAWGMSLHYSQVIHDAKVMKAEVIRAAGEFLERAHVARGMKNDGDSVRRIEGVPQKHMDEAMLRRA